MGRYWLIAATMLLVPASLLRADEITIVSSGKSNFVIATRAKPSPAEELAASQLESYLERMSGVDVAVVRADRVKQPSISVVTSRQKSVENGFAIIRSGEHVIITGDSDATTLNGVYSFLDLLGCRFLAPQLDHYDGYAEHVPKRDALTVDLGPKTESHPHLKFRKLYVEEGHSHTPENLVQMVEWMAKVGYNTLVVPLDYQGTGRVRWDNFREKVAPECQKRGIIIEVGGHGYQNFISATMEDGKLFAEHPEWFGVDEKGRRSKQKNRVFCTSNADAVAYLTKNFLAYIKDRPEIQIFDFWPPDGARWCECEACKKLGTPPDRQAILLDQVKKAVAPVRPDLRLEIIAYSSYIDPPPTAKVDKSVLVDFCPINQQFDQQINDPAADRNANYAAALQAWRKSFEGDISIYSYYRKYAWDSLPVIIPHYMQKDLQWYQAVPVQGVSSYAEPGDWFTYELNHYVLARLAWDPNADVDAIVEKFCKARYGEHASTARDALMTLGDTVRTCGSIPFTKLKSAAEIEKAQARVAEQQKKIAGLAAGATDAGQKQSLTRLGHMLRYAGDDLAVQQLRATNADPSLIKQKAQESYDFLAAHKDDGVFLNQRLSLPRKLRRYGMPQPAATRSAED